MRKCVLLFAVALALAAHGSAQESGAPAGLQGESRLPERYSYVVKEHPAIFPAEKGFWIDLGAGKGQLSVPLIEATGNSVVMLDPKKEAMAEGLKIAREKGLEDRLFAVVGMAEDLPLLDNSVDLVVSQGSIFFWDNPAKRLRKPIVCSGRAGRHISAAVLGVANISPRRTNAWIPFYFKSSAAHQPMP